jgi:hypothetical protein
MQTSGKLVTYGLTAIVLSFMWIVIRGEDHAVLGKKDFSSAPKVNEQNLKPKSLDKIENPPLTVTTPTPETLEDPTPPVTDLSSDLKEDTTTTIPEIEPTIVPVPSNIYSEGGKCDFAWQRDSRGRLCGKRAKSKR